MDGCQPFEGEEGLKRLRVRLKEEEKKREKEGEIKKERDDNRRTLSDRIQLGHACHSLIQRTYFKSLRTVNRTGVLLIELGLKTTSPINNKQLTDILVFESGLTD